MSILDISTGRGCSEPLSADLSRILLPWKEAVFRWANSPRRDGRFVLIECAHFDEPWMVGWLSSAQLDARAQMSYIPSLQPTPRAEIQHILPGHSDKLALQGPRCTPDWTPEKLGCLQQAFDSYHTTGVSFYPYLARNGSAGMPASSVSNSHILTSRRTSKLLSSEILPRQNYSIFRLIFGTN